MSDLEGEPLSPVGPEVSPDVRHAEALRALTERSIGSENRRGERDGAAILR